MSVTNAAYVGRFAPSPTGPLHAGSLLAAAASYLDARAADGRWLIRIEDIDPPREMPGASSDILHTLERFGFEWDGPVVYQSARFDLYRQRLDYIKAQTFFCDCTRKSLAAARARLGLTGDLYPETCRQRALDAGAVRFKLDEPRTFTDRIQGSVVAGHETDDFVIWRKDQLPSYQWAVSVDDIDQGITHIVRGVDLLPTTPRQIALHEAFEEPVPSFAHVPILINTEGQKLSKQTHAPALDPGDEAAQLCAAFAALGLPVASASSPASLSELWLWAIRHWDPKRLIHKKTIPFVKHLDLPDCKAT